MARPNTLPPGSFDLRPDAADVVRRIRQLLDDGLNGKQIQDAVSVSKNQFQKILARNGWKVGRNVNRSIANGNVVIVPLTAMTCPACGKVNNWRPWQLKNKTHKFCNNRCAGNERK